MAKRNKSRRRNTSKRRNTAKKTWLGILLIGLVFFVIAAAFYFQHVSSQARQRDAFGCLSSTVPEHLVIVFDRSDALNPVQKSSIQNYFTRIVDTGAVNTLYSIFEIDANKADVVKLLLRRCKPKTAGEANLLTENERLVEKVWLEEFVDPLKISVDSLLKDNPSQTSPIMESLQAVALELESGKSSADRLRIIVISDMIQNVPEFNQYRIESSFDSLRSGQYFQKIRSDFQGASIEIMYVGRAGRESIQTNRHGVFWDRYFTEMNGNLLSIERIIGE